MATTTSSTFTTTTISSTIPAGARVQVLGSAQGFQVVDMWEGVALPVSYDSELDAVELAVEYGTALAGR